MRFPLFLLLFTPSVAAADVDPPAELTVDTHLPALGQTLQVTLDGPAGAFYLLDLGFTPTELQLPGVGTLFVDPASVWTLFSGFLPAGGQVVHPLTVPADPSLEGAFFFLVAAALDGTDLGLSNALPLRIGSAPPASPRGTSAVASTPDGSSVFALHRRDGTLSVVDTTSDTVLADLPVGPAGIDGPHLRTDLAVDPDGRHLFVVHGAWDRLTVVDVETLSIAAWIPVGGGCRRVAFDFENGARRVYVTREVGDVVLVFEELIEGLFVPLPPVLLEGDGPGPLVVLDDGRLIVGHRTSKELELVDPALPPGSQTLARTPLGGIPHDLDLGGATLRVATFTTPLPVVDGRNEILTVDAATLAATGAELVDDGTDYLDVESEAGLVAASAAGTGSVVFGDGTNTLGLVDLAPFQPTATPQRSVFAGPPGARKLYVANRFRETLAVIPTDAGPPFALAGEVALAWSGLPRVPLADLSQEEDGDWWLASVNLFNGSATVPNPVTCYSCHPDGGADGSTQNRQTMPLFGLADTAPYGWLGNNQNLGGLIGGAIAAHGVIGGPPVPGSIGDIRAFLENEHTAPVSPYPETAESEVGRLLFEGAAGCSACHAAPAFIPAAPDPPTIAAGVGTGLVPANVPSLRGVWATAPYLHDGSAATLTDVLTANQGDQHGTTSGLSQSELEALAAYLRTL